MTLPPLYFLGSVGLSYGTREPRIVRRPGQGRGRTVVTNKAVAKRRKHRAMTKAMRRTLRRHSHHGH